MLRLLKSVVLVLAMVCLVGALPAKAETKIAVVDLQKIMSESKVAMSVQSQAQAYREKFQGQVTQMEDSLRDTQKLLSSEDSGLTSEQLATKKQEFEKNLASTRNLVEKKKRALDEGFSKAMEQLRAEVIKIVAGIADEKGYQLVLTRENVVIVEKSIDITSDVMDRLNADMTDIKVDVKEE